MQSSNKVQSKQCIGLERCQLEASDEWGFCLAGGAHRARAIQPLHATRVSPAFKGGTGGVGKVRNSAQLLVTTLTQWSGRGSKKCSVGPCDTEGGGRDGIRW